MEKIKEAARLLVASHKVYALTGAGISTESGIPDFRSDSGVYTTMDPMESLSINVLLNEPKRFYSEGFLLLEDLWDKEPNTGHKILAEMELKDYILGVVTQNIDNLHKKAGSQNVYEVHGETRNVHCMDCQTHYGFRVMQEQVHQGQIPPRCPKCDGTLRPNVVMFGDQMPIDYINAQSQLAGSDLIIVVGSSLTVSPGNFLPNLGKHLIIINHTPTPFDAEADFVFYQGAGETLSYLMEVAEALGKD
ncbi:MAG: NAD-dependent deacetylase [Eubacteriaceae bacterium]|nr:NAD-dependent deacetylase [Eubacteriaceae bacterium]